MSTERVQGFVNIEADGSSPLHRTANDAAERATLDGRIAELVELRPGETIVTLEKRKKIEDFASEEQNYAGFSQAAAERVTVAKTILDILDGKDGQ